MPFSSSSLRLHVESALAGRVVSPFRFRESSPPATLPTQIPALDALAGGLPRGCLTELYGPPGSGKTSILQSALAARTRASEACALVDAQDAFDPAGAHLAGVSLSRLLWVRCHGIDQALRSVDLLLHAGGFALVALDLSDVPARLVRHVPLNVWFRMRRAVEDTSTAFLVLAQESNAKTCASLVLRLEKQNSLWSLPSAAASGLACHTPACLLDGSAHTAEPMRSFQRHKKPLLIGRTPHGGSSEIANFRFASHTRIRDAEPRAKEEFSQEERTLNPV